MWFNGNYRLVVSRGEIDCSLFSLSKRASFSLYYKFIMAAEILKLPEEAFVARFRQLLGACPVVRADDYTGASVRRSEAKLCAVRAARARKDVEGAAALAASRENTAALERAAKEARREREAARALGDRGVRVHAMPRRGRGAGAGGGDGGCDQAAGRAGGRGQTARGLGV